MKKLRPTRTESAENSGPSKEPIHRFETGFASSLALAFLAVWAIAGRVSPGFEMAAATAVPVTPSMDFGTILAIVALLAINAILIAAETAIDALRPAHIKLVREKDTRRADRLQILFDQRQRVTSACVVAAQVARLTIVLATFLLAPPLLALFQDRWGWANNHANLILSTIILLVPISLLHLVLSELLPKSYASVHSSRVASTLFRFSMAVSVLFGVPASLITSLRLYFHRRFGARAMAESANFAEEEIKSLAEEAHETGELEVEEREMLHSVFEFTDTVAREVMTPRVDIDAMPIRSDPTEVANVIQESGHSRIPLYEGTDDQIVGIIHAKDLFGAMLNGKAPNLRSLMRPALFVPENKSLHELLAEMRQNRSQMAVVQDEFGGTAGIVTIEDIVEELVGDIVDEYDVEEPEIVEASGGWLVDGKMHLDDLNDAIGSGFSSEEFDTIGGYVFGLFGRQPKLGEAVEDSDWRFVIAESDGRRISRIKVETVVAPLSATSSETEP